MVQKIQETTESPQLQYTEKKVDVLVEQGWTGSTVACRVEGW